MTTLDATSVAALLREFGQRSALRGDNPFRAKAYARAADNLLTLTVSLEQIIAEERLREIPGVGEAIADIIKKLHATGAHPGLEKMRKEVPVGVLEMLTVPGLRPDKVLKLYQELGLSSLAELEGGCPRGPSAKDQGAGRFITNQDSARHRDATCGARPPAHASGSRAAENRRKAPQRSAPRHHSYPCRGGSPSRL